MFGQETILTTDLLEKLLAEQWLPSLPDQKNNLLRSLGNSSPGPGAQLQVDSLSEQFIVGASVHETVGLLIKDLSRHGIIDIIQDISTYQEECYSVKITFDGWMAYEALKRGTASGKKVFMAMPFNSDVDKVWLPLVRRAVKATGFDLRRIDDRPEPGIIDVRMRVEIQEARFAIVDLTYSNPGAYWEAGYAEGLGKRVIYTCRKGEEVHFDTAHLTRVIWDIENLALAEEQLKAMIRDALPEAIHEQD